MLKSPAVVRDGVAQCTRYAFGPNKLHLCGPDANKEVFAYMKEGISDPGLENIMKGFTTLFPYLSQIARANKIKNPFDERVVEAYWIGNELLEKISPKTFYRHLRDGLRLKDRYDAKSFELLTGKLTEGARMHHSFHVFNAYKRTGHDAKFHNLESMDACRVSWGKVLRVEGPKIILSRRPLLLDGHQLKLGGEEEHEVTRRLEDDERFDELKPGERVTIHWSVPCEIVNDQQVKWLEFYTQHSIRLANTTL